MDMLLTWILFGLVTALLSGIMESFSSKEEMATSGFLGIVGSIFGGAFGEAVIQSNLSFYHVSPLIFAVFGALIFITIAKNYPRIL